MASPIPAEVSDKFLDFLKAGKTGSFTLNIVNGKVGAWEIKESGRIDMAKSDAIN